MDDLISRQAAIDAIDEQIEQCNKALSSFDISLKDEFAIKVERASLKAYKEQLENLPTAQPKRGKWIERRTWSEGYGMGETYGKYWACNQCGREVKGFWNECGKNFCDNCGADMRGE